MFDMDLHLESSPKTVKLIDFDTCGALGAVRSGVDGQFHPEDRHQIL